MIIYTDGSSHPNPGPGGFGVVVLDDNEELMYAFNKLEKNTTNNREELKAILFAMKNYGVQESCAFDNVTNKPPIVYSDSAYSINTLTTWMFTWALRDWKTAKNKTPENLDIIKEYYDLYQQGKRIELKKVAGHSGNKWNELADELATADKKQFIEGEQMKWEHQKTYIQKIQLNL